MISVRTSTISLPEGSTGVSLAFLAGRGTLAGATVTGKGISTRSIRVLDSDVTIRFARPLQYQVTATVHSIAAREGAQLFAMRPLFGDPGDPSSIIDDEKATDVSPEQLARDWRLQHTDASTQQGFITRFDLATDSKYIQVDPDLTPTARIKRIGIVERLWRLLDERLEARYDNARLSSSDQGTAAVCECLFWSAAAALSRPPERTLPEEVGDCLENFAAGLLEHVLDADAISPGVPIEPIAFCQPDSYFLFMFAEFGIVAQRTGRRIGDWEELMGSLILMQQIYAHRWEGENFRKLTMIDGVPNSLKAETVYELRRSFEFDPDQIDALIAANLKGLAPDF